MTVVWHTNKKCVSHVEYGAGETLDMKAASSRLGLIDNDRTSHIVRLTGLNPGTRYRYRVVSREFQGYEQQHIVHWGDTVQSQIYEFKTLDPGKEAFSFSMVSDIHERAQDLESTINGTYFRGIDFAVYNGDMLNDFMAEDQVFAGFLDLTIKLFAKEMPFIYARGNHDTRGRFARQLPDYLPSVDDKTYFSFDHGGVHFVVLDSGEDKEDSHPYYNGLVDFQAYRKQEAEWLKSDLSGSTATNAQFIVIISHIPPRGGQGFAIDDVREKFEPAANRAKVDLWLSGHTHRFSRVDPVAGQNAYTLVIGSTDTVTRVDKLRDKLKIMVVRQNGQEMMPPLEIRRGMGHSHPAP